MLPAKISFKKIISCAIGFILLLPVTVQHSYAGNQTSAAAKQKPLILGVFPRRNATTTVKFFTPLTRYLAQQLGREVTLKTARDFPSFWNDVINKRFDIVHFNQYHYIKSYELNKYQVILQNEEFGKRKISGTILVRNDSGINSLQDLKNKKLTFGGGKKAMISYVVPTALLRRAGLNAGDYVEEFSKNPPNSMLSVYYRQSDAAGLGDVIIKLPSVKNSIDTSKVKFLASSEPLAHLPWAVSPDMSKTMANKIQQLMLALNDTKAGRNILKNAKLTGIHKASNSDYDNHRKILMEVFGKNY